MSNELVSKALERWPAGVEGEHDVVRNIISLKCQQDLLPEVCQWLFGERRYCFAGLIVEEGTTLWNLRYLFVGAGESGWVDVQTSAALRERSFQSIGKQVHAADWHEREAEDLFGLVFEGHPRLGDFILHDDAWQEGVEPMRRGFDANLAVSHRQPRRDWRPRRIVQAPGAFVMPIGPVYSGTAEAVHFQLETIGEEVVRVFPRLFFKYRGVEKIAEGQSVDNVLLLAERFAATTAFSHGLAFCRAVEQLGEVEVPERAQILRVFLAELERFRHHLGIIEGISSSTGLAVATSQAAILEEGALRLSGVLTGHRYLFGLVVPGGLSRDIDDDTCHEVVRRSKALGKRLLELQQMLDRSSSFLDRLQEVGSITTVLARDHGLVGPVARAAGLNNDLRRLQPYLVYKRFDFEVPREKKGDGYSRLQIFFAEAQQSLRIMEQAAAALSSGEIYSPCRRKAGVAFSGVETPRGASYHWLRLDERGRITRYRLITPSFTNWHGFHLAAENFTFQDFPIILATFGLSVSENDR